MPGYVFALARESCLRFFYLRPAEQDARRAALKSQTADAAIPLVPHIGSEVVGRPPLGLRDSIPLSNNYAPDGSKLT